MGDKIAINARLGVTDQRTDEITDAVVDAHRRTGSLRGTVEFVNEMYDSESVIAGIALNMLIIEFAIHEEENDDQTDQT